MRRACLRTSLLLLLLASGLSACRTEPAPEAASAPEPAPLSADRPAVLPAPGPAVTLVEMTPGDRGCYLTVAEGSGEAVMHLGDFGLCERADAVGRRVRLTLDTASVQAAACAGDPACALTDTVALVTRIDVIADSLR